MLAVWRALISIMAIVYCTWAAADVRAQSPVVDWEIDIYPAGASGWDRPIPLILSSRDVLIIYWRIGDAVVPCFAGLSTLAPGAAAISLAELPSHPSDGHPWFSLPGRGVRIHAAAAVYADLTLATDLPRISQVSPINSICSDDLFPSRVMDDILFRHVRALLADIGVLSAWCENMGEAPTWLKDYYWVNRRLPWVLF